MPAPDGGFLGRVLGAACYPARGTGPLGRAIGLLARASRRAAVLVCDPLVTHRCGRFVIELPLSHRLPSYRWLFPDYDGALGRLAAAVWRHHPDSSVVDIGANVGDSAAIIRSSCPAPMLCVEGDARFFALLERNARALGPRIVLERTLVGAAAGTLAARLASRGGTARIVAAEGAPGLVVEPLDAILARHPELPPPRLVKCDTDGFDLPIVEAGMPLWERLRPTLFFEYDPAFQSATDPRALWDALAGIGYDRILVWENTGDFLLSLGTGARDRLEEIHEFYRGRASLRYADLAVFHRDDGALADEVREGELRHFRSARRDPGQNLGSVSSSDRSSAESDRSPTSR